MKGPVRPVHVVDNIAGAEPRSRQLPLPASRGRDETARYIFSRSLLPHCSLKARTIRICPRSIRAPGRAGGRVDEVHARARTCGTRGAGVPGSRSGYVLFDHGKPEDDDSRACGLQRLLPADGNGLLKLSSASRPEHVSIFAWSKAGDVAGRRRTAEVHEDEPDRPPETRKMESP